MMNLQDYFLNHGMAGLDKLAEGSGLRKSYLLQLVYVPTRRPSLSSAQKLVEASGGQLTLNGLANPYKIGSIRREYTRQLRAKVNT